MQKDSNKMELLAMEGVGVQEYESGKGKSQRKCQMERKF